MPCTRSRARTARDAFLAALALAVAAPGPSEAGEVTEPAAPVAQPAPNDLPFASADEAQRWMEVGNVAGDDGDGLAGMGAALLLRRERCPSLEDARAILLRHLPDAKVGVLSDADDARAQVILVVTVGAEHFLYTCSPRPDASAFRTPGAPARGWPLLFGAPSDRFGTAEIGRFGPLLVDLAGASPIYVLIPPVGAWRGSEATLDALGRGEWPPFREQLAGASPESGSPSDASRPEPEYDAPAPLLQSRDRDAPRLAAAKETAQRRLPELKAAYAADPAGAYFVKLPFETPAGAEHAWLRVQAFVGDTVVGSLTEPMVNSTWPLMGEPIRCAPQYSAASYLTVTPPGSRVMVSSTFASASRRSSRGRSRHAAMMASRNFAGSTRSAVGTSARAGSAASSRRARSRWATSGAVMALASSSSIIPLMAWVAARRILRSSSPMSAVSRSRSAAA